MKMKKLMKTKKVIVTLTEQELEEILHEDKEIVWAEPSFDIIIKKE